MDSPALVIAKITGIEKRARVRPCTRADLERLERELEETLKSQREAGDAFVPATPQLLKATDAARSTLRDALVAHDKAQAEVVTINEMIARGHVRHAVERATKVRREIDPFSDIDLGFIDKAKDQQQRQQARLVIFGVVVAIIIFVVAAIIEILRHRDKTIS